MNTPSSEENQLDTSSRRIRTSTVTIACTNCRIRHSKCDGKTPCFQCLKRGIQCIFTSPERKRGPVAGQLKELRLKLVQLEKEIENQRILLAQTEKKYFSLLHKQNSTRVISQTISIYTMHDYLQKYMDYLYPFIQIPPPSTDLQSFIEKTEDPLKLLPIYSILSLGALVQGNRFHSDEFRSEARFLLNNFFDVLHPQIAATHFLLSRAFILIGECDKSTLFNSMAYSMAQSLLKSTQSTKIDNIDLLHIIYSCQLSSAKISHDLQKQVMILENMLRHFTTTQLQNGAPTPQQYSFLATTLLLKVWSEVTLELERAQPFHNTPSNQNEPGTQVLLSPSVAQKIFNLLRQAEKYIKLAHSPIQQIAPMGVQALTAWIYLITGQPTKALQITENVSRQIRQTNFLFPFSLFPLLANIQIYLCLKEFVKFEADLEVIRKYSPYFPIVNFCLGKISTLKEKYQQLLNETGQQVDLFGFIRIRSHLFRNEFYPAPNCQITQYRRDETEETEETFNEIVTLLSLYAQNRSHPSNSNSNSPNHTTTHTNNSNNSSSNNNNNNFNRSFENNWEMLNSLNNRTSVSTPTEGNRNLTLFLNTSSSAVLPDFQETETNTFSDSLNFIPSTLQHHFTLTSPNVYIPELDCFPFDLTF